MTRLRSASWPFSILLGLTASAFAEAPVRLAPSGDRPEIETITVDVELGGELQLPAIPGQAAAQQQPVAAQAKLVFDELQQPSRTESVRYYRTIEGEAGPAGKSKPLAVRDSRRLLAVRTTDAGRQFAPVQGLLDRSELEVLKTFADPLALAALLPNREVPAGETWAHDAEAMQSLLGIDSVGVCEASSVLSESNEHFARCMIAGVVHGVADGATVEMEIDGVYLIRRATGEVTQANFAIREKRGIGPATPGLTGVTKVRVKREPAVDSPLDREQIGLAHAVAPTEAQQLELTNPRLGYSTVVDGNWVVTGSLANRQTLRRIASEGLVSHGNIVRLDPKPLDAETSLAEFRSDVLTSLSNNSISLKSEGQWLNAEGCRVMEIVTVGQVDGVELEWHSFQVAPPEGREDLARLALSFTVEKSELERLAQQDRELVNRLRILDASELAAAARGLSK
jgi:hypothetical protein